jgi:antitoxin CptB
MELTQKKLFYKATHRGLKEADLLLGRGILPFLTEEALPEADVLFLETLLDLPDPTLMDWLLRRGTLPEPFQGAVLCEIFRKHALKN